MKTFVVMYYGRIKFAEGTNIFDALSNFIKENNISNDDIKNITQISTTDRI